MNDLVERIYELNGVKSEFWIEYLERVRSGMKITWYPSSGFDLKTFIQMPRILHNTNVVYSDLGGWVGNYSMLMNMRLSLLPLWELANPALEIGKRL
jgi:hypothetical protein